MFNSDLDVVTLDCEAVFLFYFLNMDQCCEV